ncbi:hypothetical protein BG004_000390 [Podila humilis]|nr:hypothetical protein BG004_000390 [Podila humilis]
MAPPALELPEIRSLIGTFLNTKDLVVCTQISKAWHASFASILWKTIRFSTKNEHLRRNTLIMRNIRRCAYMIRHLSYEGFDSSQQFTLGKECQFLETLTLQGTIPLARDYYTRCSVLLLQNKKTLVTLRLLDFGKQYTEPTWDAYIWDGVAQLMNLTTLYIRHTKLCTGTRFDALWFVAPQLERLELENLVINPPETYTPRLLPRMRHLVLKKLNDPDKQVEQWISQCPNLKSLCWHVNGHVYRKAPFVFPEEAFVKFLSTTQPPQPQSPPRLSSSYPSLHSSKRSFWTQLESIEILTSYYARIRNDDTLSLFLSSPPSPLKTITFGVGIEPGFESLQALETHFSTLRELNIRYCKVHSKDVRDVLIGCRTLETLIASELHAREIINSPPWVCTQLRVLRVFINMLPKTTVIAAANNDGSTTTATVEIPERIDKRQQRYIYGRLAALHQLTVLDLRLPFENDENETTEEIEANPVGFAFRSMTPSLDYGFKLLESLTKLQDLGVASSTPGQPGRHEFEWVQDHWPHFPFPNRYYARTSQVRWRQKTLEQL